MIVSFKRGLKKLRFFRLGGAPKAREARLASRASIQESRGSAVKPEGQQKGGHARDSTK